MDIMSSSINPAHRQAMLRGSQTIPNWSVLNTAGPATDHSSHLKTAAATSASPSGKSPGKSPKKAIDLEGPERFIGALQPAQARVFKNPMVNVEKGGSDFRTPVGLSSFGHQPLALPHGIGTEPRTRFSTQSRWVSEKYRSPGPVYGGPSSIGKQLVSYKATAGGVGFGTSTRDGCLKTYALYTV